jgi:hypothetical protein
VLRPEVGMATDASVCGVAGAGEHLLVDEQGNHTAGGVGFRERLVGVALETVGVGHCLRRRRFGICRAYVRGATSEKPET